MSFFSTISGIRNVSTAWYLAEEYLSFGQPRYSAQPVSHKTMTLQREERQHPHLVRTAVKILSYASILLPIIALVVRTAYRKTYSFHVVRATVEEDPASRLMSDLYPNKLKNQDVLPTTLDSTEPIELPQRADSPPSSQTASQSPIVKSKRALSSFKTDSSDCLDMAQTLASEEESLPIVREKKLCKMLSNLQTPLTGKTIVVFSKDLGGYGDFMFGFKTLSMLDTVVPGNRLIFATDSPERSLRVKENSFPMVLGNKEKVSIEELATAIDTEHPDLLIVAPCTNFSRNPISHLLSNTLHFFVREYGWTKEGLGEDGDYVSGAGAHPLHTGIFIDGDLQEWANRSESTDAQARLVELKKTPKGLQEAILGAGPINEKLQEFATTNELFLAYGGDNAKTEFMASVAQMHQTLNTQKNLTFVCVGSSANAIQKRLESQKELFQSLGIGKIVIKEPKLDSSEILIDETSTRSITCIPVELLHDDVIALVKASEKEILSTGDQSWGEAISAHKHWIQEDTLHKRSSLQSVVRFSQKPVRTLLQKAFARRALSHLFNTERVREVANLLYHARVNPQISDSWASLNHAICEKNNIQPWFVGMVRRKFLEYDPRFQELWKKAIAAPHLSKEDLLEFLHVSDQIAREPLHELSSS